MVMGVTMDYLCVCALLALCTFILLSNPLYLLIYVPLHLIGWALCKLDAHIFQVIIMRARCGRSPSAGLWGCQSYEPY